MGCPRRIQWSGFSHSKPDLEGILFDLKERNVVIGGYSVSSPYVLPLGVNLMSRTPEFRGLMLVRRSTCQFATPGRLFGSLKVLSESAVSSE
jgi:hypothetical protein